MSIAVVTGASRGIGAAVARRFASEGYDVVLGYRSDTDGAKATRDAIRERGRRCVAIPADLSDPTAVETFFSTIFAKFGRVDALVNNAGITEPEPPTETSVKKWDRMIQVNLSSVYYCCRAVLDHMIKRRTGSIVNISSVCGKNGGLKAGVHYSAAKAGVNGLTKGLADHVAQYGIRVNAIAPAMIDTEMIRWRPAEVMRQTIARIPVKRLGTVDEVAAVVWYLSGTHSSFVTGTVVDINGGLYMD